jgi:microcystin-dependent protein
MRGRGLFTLDQGTGRNGLSVYQSSGSATLSITLGSSNIPAHSHPINDIGHFHTITGHIPSSVSGNIPGGGNEGFSSAGSSAASYGQTDTLTTGITVANSTYAGAAVQGSNLPPAIAHGITMVRAG